MRVERVPLVLFAATAVGCAAEAVSPLIGEPYFYLVLEPGRVWSSVEPGAHFAVALTIETPGDVRCRAVDSLEMRRESDGARFAWTVGSCEEVFGPSIPLDSCCRLPFDTTVGDAVGASAFVTDEAALTSGLEAGLGVFGSISESSAVEY